MITIESFRTHRHSRANVVDDPNVFTIRRGYRIRLHNDDTAAPWEIWRIVNVARVHALEYQTTQRIVFRLFAFEGVGVFGGVRRVVAG